KALSGGSASLTISNLAVGNAILTAVYAGSGSNLTTTSNSGSQTATQAATKTPLRVSGTTPGAGQLITYTSLGGAVKPGAGRPTGTVTFKDGSTVLGTVNLQVVNKTIKASLTTSLTAGSHAITVVYSGDVNFQTSTSTVLPQTVGQASTQTVLSA